MLSLKLLTVTLMQNTKNQWTQCGVKMSACVETALCFCIQDLQAIMLNTWQFIDML